MSSLGQLTMFNEKSKSGENAEVVKIEVSERKEKCVQIISCVPGLLIIIIFLNTHKTPKAYPTCYLILRAFWEASQQIWNCEWRQTENVQKNNKKKTLHLTVAYIFLWFAFKWLQTHQTVTEPCRKPSWEHWHQSLTGIARLNNCDYVSTPSLVWFLLAT